MPEPPALMPLRHEVEVSGALVDTSGTMRPVSPVLLPLLLMMTCPPLAVALPPPPPVADALPPVPLPPVATELARAAAAALALARALEVDSALAEGLPPDGLAVFSGRLSWPLAKSGFVASALPETRAATRPMMILFILLPL